MANNRGGKIMFGIKDSPRTPIGLANEKFQNCDPNKFNQVIHEFYSHEFDWELSSLEFNGLEFGVIEIKESRNKPILCKKSKQKLREGAIYYRYRGETKEIAFPELSNILIKEKEKERMLWMSHIEKISDIGPQNIHFMDTYKGEIHIGNEKVLIDEKLLEKIKFIKEGEFVEKEGAPALTIAGEISGVVDNGKIMHTDLAYPYLSTHLQKDFSLSQYQVGCLIFKLRIRDNPKYHEVIKTGKKSVIHKYSQALYERVKSILERYPSYIDEACKEFQKDQKEKRQLKKKK
jgi:hypothetical protein